MGGGLRLLLLPLKKKKSMEKSMVVTMKVRQYIVRRELKGRVALEFIMGFVLNGLR